MKAGLMFTLFLCLSAWSCIYEVLQEDTVSLRNEASFPVGTLVSYRQLISSDSVKSLVAMEFNSITPLAEFRMDSILPGTDEFRWEMSDSLAAFSRQYNLRLFGHELIGHKFIPAWLKAEKHDKTSVSHFLEDYIGMVVGRYKNSVQGWNAVSEPLNRKGDSLRNNLWFEILGEAYIDLVFNVAHKTDPKAVLFINDIFPGNDTTKLESLVRLIHRLKERKVPVHGIGLHLRLTPEDPPEMVAAIFRKAAETKLQVHISHLEVVSAERSPDVHGKLMKFTSEMADKQAEKYLHVSELYRNIVPENQQYGITLQGFGWGKVENEDWPALFDEALRRKPAYYGILNGVRK